MRSLRLGHWLALVTAILSCSQKQIAATENLDRITEPPRASDVQSPSDTAKVAGAVPGLGAVEVTRDPDVGPSDASRCSWTELEAFRGWNVKWEGECKAGKAHGKGVLRARPKTDASRDKVCLFFGEMVDGEASIGVIETSDGFLAGEFHDGRLVDSDDRNLLIRAFEVASKAAALASRRFSAAGNQASSRFYAKKSQILANQMD